MTALTATLDATAGVLLKVTGAPAGAVTITRTDANGTGVVRLRQGQVPIAGALTVTDSEAALVGLITYTVTDSAGATASRSVTGAYPSPRLGSAQLPQLAAVLESVTGYTAARQSTTTVHRVIGRDDPVVVLGRLRLREGRLESRHTTYEAALEVATILAEGGIVQLRQPTHPGLDMYLVAANVDTAPLEVTAEGWHWQTVADYVEVRSPALPLLGAPGWSYGDVTATHTTYAVVRQVYGNYSALVVGS